LVDTLALIGQDASSIVQSENETHNSRKGSNNDPSLKKELLDDATIGNTCERVEFNDWFKVKEEDVAHAMSFPSINFVCMALISFNNCNNPLSTLNHVLCTHLYLS
jgi:hypothetical protein